MSNKRKLKEIKIKLEELNAISIRYNKGLVNDEEYSEYLKTEIDSLKKIKINEFKNNIKNGLIDIEILKKIKNKLDFNDALTEEEKLFITSYL